MFLIIDNSLNKKSGKSVIDIILPKINVNPLDELLVLGYSE